MNRKNKDQILAITLVLTLLATVAIPVIGQSEPPQLKKQLRISAPLETPEGTNFTVFVYIMHSSPENNTTIIPIEGAKVTFRNLVVYTNADGIAMFFAPYVEGTIVEVIYAEKAGYLPAKATIIIYSSLIIYAPTSVEEGMDFMVTVLDSEGMAMGGAKVTFEVNESCNYTHEVKYTNENGTVWFTAPLVIHDMEGSLLAEKKGYRSDVKNIMIEDTSGGEQYLVIYAPPSVFGGDIFSLCVSDGEGHPIMDVRVDFSVDGYNQIEFTNWNGTAWFTAPELNESIYGDLYAMKEGYDPDHTLILVIAEELSLGRLSVNVSSVVLEGTNFSVYVSDQNGSSVVNATVFFTLYGCNGSGNDSFVSYTGDDGRAWFVAPYVEEDTLAEIFAYKNGYLESDRVIITILDLGH